MFEKIRGAIRSANAERKLTVAEEAARREAKEKKELKELKERNKAAQLKLNREQKLDEARKRKAQLDAEQFAREPVVRGAKAAKGVASGLHRKLEKTIKSSRPGWYKRGGYNTLIGDFSSGSTPKNKVLHYHQQASTGGWAYHSHADGQKRHQHSKFGLIGYSRWKPRPQARAGSGRVIIVR